MKKCSRCRSESTLVYRKKHYWYHDKDGAILCRTCWNKAVYWPRRGRQRVKFMGRRLIMTFDFRRGICSILECAQQRTDFHHIEYHIPFPLLTGVELCDMHHREETMKQQDLGEEYEFDWKQTKQMVPYIVVNNS